LAILSAINSDIAEVYDRAHVGQRAVREIPLDFFFSRAFHREARHRYRGYENTGTFRTHHHEVLRVVAGLA
jgi:hypothetical protein